MKYINSIFCTNLYLWKMKLKYKSIFFFLNISLHTFHKFTRTFTFTAIRIARQTNRFANIGPTRVSINPIRIRSPRRTRKTTGRLVSPLSYRWPINLQAHTRDIDWYPRRGTKSSPSAYRNPTTSHPFRVCPRGDKGYRGWWTMYRDRVTYYRPRVRQMRPLFLGSSGFSCQEGWGRLVQPPVFGVDLFDVRYLLEYWIKCDLAKWIDFGVTPRYSRLSPFLSIIQLFARITKIK